ncbi:MAG: DEAD/DEAH box helicase family protein [Candidatus Cloacimonetes bacterium]|nr:DEAD/DEAH box helicase family protein [Candidatus Cloacimonadota bacterium]
MKIQFKDQQFQIDAVESVLRCFEGQALNESASRYRRDLGTCMKPEHARLFHDMEDDTGYKNAEVSISNDVLINNIRLVQRDNNLRESDELATSTRSKDPETKKMTDHKMGRCILDIEMETGTGKTYVYIRTMFELSAKYGWNKFIVVTPSTAVREGVKKTFEITADHFMVKYGRKARFFVYDSAHLCDIDDFSRNDALQVMIINNQAFGARDEKSRRIYDKRDDFRSRKPIDVIAANNPIIILDEPQELGGPATQSGLAKFNPLFLITYSATHKEHHNTIYALDAVDAYNKKLVKKIAVKGIEVTNVGGKSSYVYAESPVLSLNAEPKARVSFEIKRANGIKRETRIVKEGDDLYPLSGELQQYWEGYVISQVDPINNVVHFLNGLTIPFGTVNGDINEKDIRRIQIRETIKSHFEKEETNFKAGIKTLSLFFIDEVAKYRQYENGEPVLGEYAKIFEEEYAVYLQEHLEQYQNSSYAAYIKKFKPHEVHEGYFSIDKKGKMVDPSKGKKSLYSDDISAYDLILKNKERLLSFEEPIRFIFSHSALGIGWDNPNVFQICTLKQSDSSVKKHQEVGRGLRLCVNNQGERIDSDTPWLNNIHDVNKLTVIVSESYKNFVTELQESISEDLYERPEKVTPEYLKGKVLRTATGEKRVLTNDDANDLYFYLRVNGYIDSKGKLTDQYHEAVKTQTLVQLPEEIQTFQTSLHELIGRVGADGGVGIDDDRKRNIIDNKLRPDNFYKRQFQTLWHSINKKSIYQVSFNSEELIEKSRVAIDTHLNVPSVTYRIRAGEQRGSDLSGNIKKEDFTKGNAFSTSVHSADMSLKEAASCNIAYDLLGSIANETSLTRKTVAAILKQISARKFDQFKENPEAFLQQVSQLINEQKSTIIVEKITYDMLNETFDDSIFTMDKCDCEAKNAFASQKHVLEYVFTDGYAKDGESVEKKFVRDLDTSAEVCVYAKLPSGFYIPTPVGRYSPDWAIAFNEESVRHVYFIAETKGSLSSMQLKKIEESKIECARKWFNTLNLKQEDIRYGVVTSFEDLLALVNGD